MEIRREIFWRLILQIISCYQKNIYKRFIKVHEFDKVKTERPVLDVGPGGTDEDQAPHEQVGEVGQGVQHQQRAHLHIVGHIQRTKVQRNLVMLFRIHRLRFKKQESAQNKMTSRLDPHRPPCGSAMFILDSGSEDSIRSRVKEAPDSGAATLNWQRI